MTETPLTQSQDEEAALAAAQLGVRPSGEGGLILAAQVDQRNGGVGHAVLPGGETQAPP